MKLKFEDLQDTLEYAKKLNPELAGMILHRTDARAGNKVALAKTLAYGVIDNKTGYLTFGEMQQFLWGYMSKAENRFRLIKHLKKI
jgi:hypothetical protein